MIKCVNDECSYFKEYDECSSACLERGFKKIITNYDLIRNMSIEEMAEFLANYVQNTVDKYSFEWEQWLESEVTE